jgi:acyl transferase domain-containing protein
LIVLGTFFHGSTCSAFFSHYHPNCGLLIIMAGQSTFPDYQTEYNPWVEDPIAIIGIGLRLPGSVRTPQQYWEFLTRKGSGRGRVPASRYNVDAFLGPKGKPGHTCTEYGYFLEDVDLAAADSSFWSIPPKELELLDPQQRLMMEVVYECLESSGTASFKGKDIGCYVGVLGEDWMDIQTKDPHHSGMHRVGGYGDFAISNRVSKELGLTGPSMTIRTACSSSLMALHSACQALYVGECSSAVVGGCNLILSPRMTVTMSEHRVISPTGNCRSFDAQADGYARGEAVNAIHIKRLSSALRDGDPIRAVIRSVCINSDGQRSPLFIPSPESHELLIRRSHQLAGITDLSQTAMIECHGTGTMVGDTLEGRAVDNVFGELGGVLIGSVGNIDMDDVFPSLRLTIGL